MNWTPKQLEEYNIKRGIKTNNKPNKNTTGSYKSKGELVYANVCEVDLRAGLIVSWSYECIKFKVIDARDKSVWYTPDFMRVYPDGRIEIVEVKGYMRDAGKYRFLAAVEKNPHIHWRMIRLVNGEWEEIYNFERKVKNSLTL